MQYPTKKTPKWQETGGSFVIPDGWFVTKVDLDAEEPYAKIYNNNSMDEKTILIPKSLAYYLGTHFCGSKTMREMIEKDVQHSIRTTIEKALGIK